MPTNILISKPERKVEVPSIKLADFGLCSDVITDHREAIKNPLGTEGWMAPELYHSDKHDSKVDIFSLGILFYYTLTDGKHPFGNDANIQTIQIVKKESPVVMQNALKSPYSKDFLGSKLIQWMLEMEPWERPTTGKILNHNFFGNHQRGEHSSNKMTTKNVASLGIQDIKAQMGSTYILGMHLKDPNEYKR